MIGGDGSKTGLVRKNGKHKSTTGIGASLTWATEKRRRATIGRKEELYLFYNNSNNFIWQRHHMIL